MMDTYLTNIENLNAAGASPQVMGAFVVYDLPDRDCAAAASNGEPTDEPRGLRGGVTLLTRTTRRVLDRKQRRRQLQGLHRLHRQHPQSSPQHDRRPGHRA